MHDTDTAAKNRSRIFRAAFLKRVGGKEKRVDFSSIVSDLTWKVTETEGERVGERVPYSLENIF